MRATSMCSLILASALGTVSVGADCGSGASAFTPQGSEPDASVATRFGGALADGAAAPDAGDAGEAKLVPNGLPDAGIHHVDSATAAMPQEAGIDAGAGGGGFPGCIRDYEPCTGAGMCCALQCDNGGCGGCLAEGNQCETDMDCCGGLACTAAGDAGKFCGTNLCSPDGTACGGGTPCCNDDCIDGICGGS